MERYSAPRRGPAFFPYRADDDDRPTYPVESLTVNQIREALAAWFQAVSLPRSARRQVLEEAAGRISYARHRNTEAKVSHRKKTLRALHRSTNETPGIVPTLVSHLRGCAVDLVRRASTESAQHSPKGNGGNRHKIDKSLLTIGEPKRIRCKEHLRFVASQPCVICGRTPSHAHHVRYAQSRGLSLKVSDEFTVPLCATHHQDIHTTGKEREWWQERNIDPLKVASALWQQSCERDPSPPRADAAEANALGGREAEPKHHASPAIDAIAPGGSSINTNGGSK